MTEMEKALISALAAIDRELGMPEDGCNSTQAALTAIRLLNSAHRDDVAEIEHLTGVIAACRDVLPTPTQGSAAEPFWSGAMCAPEHVPAYVKAAFDAQAAEIERLRADAARYRWLRKDPQFLGFGVDMDATQIDELINAAIKGSTP